jgi:hypothetical protein
LALSNLGSWQAYDHAHNSLYYSSFSFRLEQKFILSLDIGFILNKRPNVLNKDPEISIIIKVYFYLIFLYDGETCHNI